MLEGLGLNTADILATAADRSAGEVDVQHIANFETLIGEGRVFINSKVCTAQMEMATLVMPKMATTTTGVIWATNRTGSGTKTYQKPERMSRKSLRGRLHFGSNFDPGTAA